MKTRVALAGLVAAAFVARRASADTEVLGEVRLAPSLRGVLGAWAVAGPFPAATADRDVVAVPISRWKLVTSGGPGQDPGSEGSRTVDLKSSLENAKGRDIIAFAMGKLHLAQAGRVQLLLGVDDGVRVEVDGAVVFSRDDGRPLRDDDDIVPLNLSAGDHKLVLRFHQRDGAWAFRARIVGDDLAPPPGAYLTIPVSGSAEDAAKTLANKMSWLVVDRAFDPRSSPPRYRPVLTVRYPEGAPIGVPIAVSAKIDGQFDVNAGGVAGPEDLVVALPPIEPWSGTLTLESNVAGRLVKSTLVARPDSEQALVHFDKAIAHVAASETWLAPGSLDSARHLAKRLARFVARGDSDSEAQLEEAKELDRVAAALEKKADPYAERTGMMRRALVTPFDSAPTEYGLYVPPSYKVGGTKKYPLIVGLHGMNSAPLSMMRALFGQDDEKKDPWWKDRHAVPLPPVDAFVITPYAHGNTMYRELGEDDVLYLMEWAKKTFPIDDTRISVTGPSMGGIGSASLPFHYPGVFDAAEPLCGYHSYLIRAELNARPKRPWERALLEERSNVLWAENGEHLPLYIVHGTRDLPVANSDVLIERYEKLHYSVKHEHPDAGHNVWGVTYGDLKGIKWLLSQPKLDAHPSHVRFRTMRMRYATSAWVTVDALENELGWADIDARRAGSTATLKTSGATQLTLRLDGVTSVAVDGTSLTFAADEALVMHRASASEVWAKGPATHAGLFKHGHVTGPIRDVFHEPITFVYAEDERASAQVARSFAERPGIPAGYPVLSDTDFLARKEPLANDRALFLVGRSNKVLAALSAIGPLPMQVESGAVSIAGQRITGREVGAAYIYPNPARPERYVVVVAGADVAGMLRAQSLPDLLPDFVVWDADLAPARGQVLLGAASLRAGGMFKADWSLPAAIADPLAKKMRGSAATSEPAESTE